MLIEEIIDSNILIVDCNKTVYEACQLFKKKEVDYLIAVDKDVFAGLITERDIIERVILQDKSPKKTKIFEILQHNLITVDASTSCEKAKQIMEKNNLRFLPVLLNNKIIGVVNKRDLIDTSDIYSKTLKELEKYYKESKKNLRKIKNNWEKLTCELNKYKK